MDKTKLIELLKTLNKTELERFGVFLDTPLFNERKTICRLFNEVKKFYPGFNGPLLTKEKIFDNLYLSKPYNDELMRNLISRLYKLLENYLSFINYEKDKFNKEYRLLDELNSRGNEMLFKKKFEVYRKSTEEINKIELETLYMHYRLSNLSLEHFFTFPHQPDVDMNILNMRKIKLIDYFLSDILNVYSMMAHDMTLHPEKKYDFDMLESITLYIENNPVYLKNNIYLQINFYVLKLLLTGNDEYYHISRKLISENSMRLSRSEKSKHYTALLSYIQSKIFEGEQAKIRDKFELYIEMFANEGAYHNNFIKHAEIILAVNNSLMLSEFRAAEEYVNKYIDEVESYYRQSTKHYCFGLIDYYKKEYKNALINLSKVDYDDISYKNLVRTLKLMIYFSMNDHEGFYALVDSFRHFIDINKKVSPYNYRVNSNLINFTFRLFKGKEDPEKFDVVGFRREVLETNHVARKQWLIQMIGDFENETKQKKAPA